MGDNRAYVTRFDDEPRRRCITPATAGTRIMHWLCLSHSGTDIDDDGDENEMHTSTPHHHHPPPKATTQQPALSDPTSAHGLSQQALSISGKPPKPNNIQTHAGRQDSTRLTDLVLAPGHAGRHHLSSFTCRVLAPGYAGFPHTIHMQCHVFVGPHGLGSRTCRAPTLVVVLATGLGSRAQAVSHTISTCNVKCLLGWLM